MNRIRAVFFDLDGTLVRYRGVDFESSWGAIGIAAGLAVEWRRLQERYLPRPELYDEWLRANARLLAGRPVRPILERLLPPPYPDGVREAIGALRARGLILGIVSSGLSLVADHVREDLGLDFAVANVLEVVNGRFSGRAELRVPLWAKDGAVREAAARYGLDPREVAFVGDNFNDVPVFALVGLGIAYAPKDPRVIEAAHVVATEFREIPALIP
ncbi:MAG: HAD-IB family phosphatase [Caldiserica bacterium]|nr:HAD-IB family phosphatase [Caldisericota bacterium]